MILKLFAPCLMPVCERLRPIANGGIGRFRKNVVALQFRLNDK